jgi:hypothetical protein
MSARSFVLGKRRQGNITMLNNDNSVQLHDTVICNIVGDMIVLDNGGYYTNTTKTAMNRFFKLKELPYTVYQKKGTWYVFCSNNGANMEFYNGLKLYANKDLMPKNELYKVF